MNCPHCQSELPENNSAAACPFCGNIVSRATPGSKRIGAVFFVVLLAPAIVNLIGITVNSTSLVVGSTFAGSAVAGMVCARLLLQRRSQPHPVLTVLLGVLLGGVSFFLCFLGCAFSLPWMHPPS